MKYMNRFLAFALALVLLVSPFTGAFSLRASAEGTTRVHFYNSASWATVKAYVYGASNGEALGAWGGAAAVEEGGGWWYVDVPASPEFTIIFHNDAGNQTASVNIVSNVFVGMDGVAYATRAEAEEKNSAAPEKLTFWFYNDQGWAGVSAHIYNETGTMFGDWPGAALTAGEGSWYSLEVDAATLSQYYTIIFNNNGAGQQLPGVDVPTKAAPYFAGGSWYASKEAAEAAVAGPAGTTVWFYNSDNWATVKAYVYGASNGEALGSWGGTAATRDGDTNWWSVEVPANPNFTIIFHNDAGSQTTDVNIVSNVYVGMDGVAYTTKAEAEEKNSAAPEKLTFWFYNDQGWAGVSAHIYNETGTMFGDWPGAALTAGEGSWYSLEVDAATLSQYYTIIFNNNGAGQQLPGVDVPTKAAPYFAGGSWYASKEAAEAAVAGPASTTVWFYNSDNWTTVKAYVYGASNGEALGSWGGTAATRDGDTNWWSVEVPANPNFTIIFHNDAGSQTGDTSIADKTNVYVAVSSTTPYASREAAEAAVAGPASTTVWFYNSKGWDTVMAYVYGASNGEALGSWGGTAATRDGDTNWWSVDVPANPSFTIIFHNNAGSQTGDTPIRTNTGVYVTANNTTTYTSREAAEKSMSATGSTTVWFYNSESWETVKAYVYGASNGEALGSWSGTTATRDGDTAWWSVEVPADPEFYIIFNNDSGAQTQDVPIRNSGNVYVTLTGNEPFGDRASAQAAQEAMDQDRKGTVRVWFYNSEGWATVNAYVYGAANGEALGSWPGTKATRDGERWWYVDIDADRPYFVIFNNGTGSQSPDTRINGNTNLYVTMNKDGVYASKEEAEASISSLKPIVSPYTTVWFYNNLGWKNVCAYAWGTANPDPLGSWPGSRATRYEDTDWWYYTCPFPVSFYIIFNDGIEGGAQTQGVHITDSWNVYTTYQSDKKYNSMEAAEAAVGEKQKVYFYNSNGWSQVYAYSWGGVQGESFGSWPGTPATRENETSYWYYVEVLAGTQQNIIFNNGVDAQTNGVPVGGDDKFYLTVNDEKFATREEAEATIDSVADILPARTNKAYTLWYYNTENWDEVYLYVLTDKGEAFFGSQPGIRMHRQGNTGWFYMNVAAEFDFTVQFSDGKDAATQVFTVADKDSIYFTFQSQYTSRNEAMGLTEEELPETEVPIAENPAQPDQQDLTGAIVGGSVISVAAIGGYALILGRKRRKTVV